MLAVSLVNSKLFWAIFAAFALGIVIWAAAWPMASAQEQEGPKGEVRVSAGPHDVRVILVNSNLAAGFVQFSVLVRNAATGEVVPDARVVLLAKNEEEKYEGWATALNSPALPEQYDARVNLDSTGDWLISIDVDSPLGRGGADLMTLHVPALQRYTSGSLVFFGVFAVLIGGVAYLWWSVRRNQRRKAAQE
jgi:hypothetical protein